MMVWYSTAGPESCPGCGATLVYTRKVDHNTAATTGAKFVAYCPRRINTACP